MRTKAFIGLLLLLIITYISLPETGLAAEKNRDIEAIGARNINAGQMNFYSVEREIALGRELAEELESSSRILDDPEINEYINRFGQNLVRSSDAKVPFVICAMRFETPSPCSGPRANDFSTRRSSVPCNRSTCFFATSLSYRQSVHDRLPLSYRMSI